MRLSSTEGIEFVRQVLPFLQRHDVWGLRKFLHRHWPNRALRGVLRCGCSDAANTALVCLSLTGTMRESPLIARMLGRDGVSRRFAEHALWTIWMRGSDSEAREKLMEAVELANQREPVRAAELLEELIADHPRFAEAYHQLGLIRFMQGEYVAALSCFWKCVELNPLHYSAIAAAGHCHAFLGQLGAAMLAYQSSLRIHPHQKELRAAVERIRTYFAEHKPPTPLPQPKHT